MISPRYTLYINADNNGYEPEQCGKTLTVGELIALLRDNYDYDSPVYLRFDGGYSYGSITDDNFKEVRNPTTTEKTLYVVESAKKGGDREAVCVTYDLDEARHEADLDWHNTSPYDRERTEGLYITGYTVEVGASETALEAYDHYLCDDELNDDIMIVCEKYPVKEED